jgi:ABC-2 type transport system ATP-binding protein
MHLDMIKVANLTFGYSKKALLFEHLNLDLQVGHIYGLLGKNGAGKSTLLKNIAGLAFPLAGHCTVNGFNSANRLPAFLQELFFIPEEIYMPSLTAIQFIKSTAHFYPKFDETLFYKMLSEFDVQTNHVLSKLSFGQQKKVMISFGMATNTSLLIMDEPTNGLDIPSKIQFRKIIASALTEDRCIIISTHQVRDLDSLIDTLVVLHNKEIVLNKSLDDLSERVQFSNLLNAKKEDILYTEENSMGINTISKNSTNNYNKVDMELLFNAITTNQSTVTEYLK